MSSEKPETGAPEISEAQGSEAIRQRNPEERDAAAILIVDDERGPRESLRMILSGSYRVLTAESGARALELLQTESVDLVTVDLNMPGMKGDELMRTVRTEFPQVELIIITGCGSIETAIEGIRHGIFDYLTKPFDVIQVLASVERALDRRASRGRMVSLLEDISRILGTHRNPETVLAELDASPIAQERLRRLLEEPAISGENGHFSGGEPRALEFLEVLAETIESRDLFMRGHARRCAFYADLMADRLLLSREDREHVRMAAFVHDIGKVGATTDLLAGELIPEPERLATIEAHPVIGERLLRPLGLASSIATTVRHHHEHYDGRGYPDKLAGEEIPLAARIVAIVDAFDAMTCERPYRLARTQEEALLELHQEAGLQFDPGLVRIFIQLIESGAAEALNEAASMGPAQSDPSAPAQPPRSVQGAA